MRIALVVVLVLAATTCGRERSAPPTARGGGPPSSSSAEDDHDRVIAKASCARVKRCGGISPTGAFASEEDCLDYLLETDIDPLGVARCRSIEPRALRACLDAYAAQDCEDNSTPEACMTKLLCPRGSMR
ncbi:MAG: hypothetical protein ACXWUG_06605 [Polyangiales bacterium]